jgi:hypothetical protein
VDIVEATQSAGNRFSNAGGCSGNEDRFSHGIQSAIAAFNECRAESLD